MIQNINICTFHRYKQVWILMLSLFLYSACAKDDHIEHISTQTETTERKNITLQFQLAFPHPATSRAAGHTQDTGTEAENWIDVDGKDYKLLVFDTDNGQLVTDDVSILTFKKESSADHTKYTVIGEIDLRQEANKQLKNFQVMVLANWHSFTGKDYSAFNFSEKSILNEDAQDIFKDVTNFNFTTPNSPSATSWQPSIEDKQFIPMFGLSEELSVDNAVENWLFSKEIPMLRSIAKVEIINNVSDGEISAVTLSRSNANGRFIPDIRLNGDWNNPATQVTQPSLPEKVNDVENLPFCYETKRLIDGEEKSVWVAYIPEMYLSSSVTGKERPMFNITFDETQTVAVKFDNYVDGKQNTAAQLPHVLRNHIYRYTISGSLVSIEMELEVDPWTLYDEDTFRFDMPQVAPDGYLKWKTTYLDDDGQEQSNGYIDMMPDEMKLIMKDGTSDYAEGTFTLSAPLGAKWFATLVSTSGELDAFSFEGKDNGVIDGEPATIRIKNTRESVSTVNNEARLVIMVEYPDKTQKEVIVVAPSSKGKNYVIVQRLTNIMSFSNN